VLRVTHLITDLDTGGAEVMLARLVDRRHSAAVDHTVISLTTIGSVGKQISSRGIPVYAVGVQPAHPNPATLWKLVRLLRTTRPNLLQTWLYHADLAGLIAGTLAGVPAIVWNVRCGELDARDYRRSLQLLLKILAWCSNRPAVIVCNSHAGRAAHERLGYRPRRWEVIPNGLDLDIFRPSASARSRLRRDLGLSEATRVVGTLARYHPMKDHATFFRAAAIIAGRHTDVHFAAAGRSVAGNPMLVELVDRYGLNGRVTLLGEQAQPADFLSGCDVVVSSSSYGEGFPNVVAEAMACGVPCVVTDVGDAARIVGDMGIVVPPRDSERLARGVLHYLDVGSAGIDDISRAARLRIADQFSLDRVIQRYDDLYGQVTGRTLQRAENRLCAE
jgi:glycosyltransferase involved in cell wall biosynthesis